MRRILQVVIPLVILALFGSIAAALVAAREKPERSQREPVIPVVRAVKVEIRSQPIIVSSQGTVRPRTQSGLVTELGGTVVEIAPNFAAGGFFNSGDLLLRIDPADYRQAVAQAKANVVQAEVTLEQERAEARVALQEWNELGNGKTPSALTTRELYVERAAAALDAAQAALERAERDLERTVVRAPYAGIVRDKQVDRGQFVNRGQQLGSIYAIDVAEVLLPLPDEDLAFVDLPYAYRDGTRRRGPKVTLIADFAGAEHRWRGRIVRTEGEIDPRTRLVQAVAQVDDPYGRAVADRPPLATGLFVRAEIEGRTVDGVVRLPRAALRPGSEVLLIDGEDRLRFRQVEVLRGEGSDVVVRGLPDGARVCISPLATVTDGMQVQVEIGAESPEA